ncbi:Hypothetical predicted protein, partial [Marmota monax]
EHPQQSKAPPKGKVKVRSWEMRRSRDEPCSRINAVTTRPDVPQVVENLLVPLCLLHFRGTSLLLELRRDGRARQETREAGAQGRPSPPSCRGPTPAQENEGPGQPATARCS